MMDVTAIGEILIDLTQTGKNESGVPLFAANPGGAPANVAVAAARLVVNATPLGTAPRTDESPRLPYDALTAEHRLFDLVYNPPLTRFLEQGARRGARILNGEVMLHAQAEAAWRIWNGDPE